MGVDDAARIACIGHMTAKRPGKAEPFLDLAQDENAAIRRQLAAIESGCDFFAANG